jgi:hypothetical protein
MLVCVIPGRDCMIVVAHVIIVDGEHHRAKRDKIVRRVATNFMIQELLDSLYTGATMME